MARFKAAILNDFVERKAIRSVLELGCGDGSQLSLATYPCYVGLDVSAKAIEICKRKFVNDRSKMFVHYGVDNTAMMGSFFRAELVLSLDVLYHLVEDSIYRDHIDSLFSISTRYVAIFSSDHNQASAYPHVRHRHFSRRVAERFPEFALIQHDRPEGLQTFAEMFIFEKAL